MATRLKHAAQRPLFPAAVATDRELGLLGWNDPLWTRKFDIELLSGAKLTLDLVTIRRLHALVKAGAPKLALWAPYDNSPYE